MTLILKDKPLYEKIYHIERLLNYIKSTFDIDITFDNRKTNNYKLIIDGKAFGFNDYNGVINALKFVIACGEHEEN